MGGPGERAIEAFRRLPPRWRERIKRISGAAGHARGPWDDWRARRLAAGAKRPDLVAASTGHFIGSLGWSSLAGKRVMEYGAGYLLAEPLAATLYGAREVDALDYERLLRSRPFRRYAASDWAPACRLAAARVGEAAVEAWRRRLEASLASRRRDWFNELGVRYLAPFDLLADGAGLAPYDLIQSRSTLEHLPPDRAPAILRRMAELVAPGGGMVHYIHLEDHRDFADPFAFLAADSDYRPSDFDRRGNRLRAADWRALFQSLPGLQWRFLEKSKDACLLPARIAPEFAHHGPDALCVVHLTAIGRRLPG